MNYKTTITRRIEFDAGHRVYGHENKCANLHGHRYVAEITVSASELDSVSRVVDFSVIKSVIGKWIDDNWDHTLLLNTLDPLARMYYTNSTEGHDDINEKIFGPKEPYFFYQVNPTAEVMARQLYNICVDHPELTQLTIERVRIYETPNCWADYPQ